MSDNESKKLAEALGIKTRFKVSKDGNMTRNIEEIEKLLDNCYSLKRIKRILDSMLMCSDIYNVSALDCKNKCLSKDKSCISCIDCFMHKFLDTDNRLQKLDLERGDNDN